MEAGAHILERNGLEGYTTNAIAERAGVSIGSFYQFFPNKDAVTVALIEREADTLLADMAAIESAKGFEAGLNHMIRSAIAHQMRRPKLARLLDFEEDRLPMRSRNKRVADIFHAALLRILGQSKKRIAGDGEMVALDVFAIMKGMVDAAGEREETDALDLERRVCRALFGYLGVRYQGE
jgi:AcrR family transcriptional regulator